MGPPEMSESPGRSVTVFSSLHPGTARARRSQPARGRIEGKWLGEEDSNLRKMIQSHLGYHYLIPQRPTLGHYTL